MHICENTICHACEVKKIADKLRANMSISKHKPIYYPFQIKNMCIEVPYSCMNNVLWYTIKKKNKATQTKLKLHHKIQLDFQIMDSGIVVIKIHNHFHDNNEC